MKKIRKISASKIRYDQTHPLICFRTTTEEKEKIEVMAETTQKTISQIVTELLLKGYVDIENAYNEGFNFGMEEGEGFGRKDGKSEWGIEIPCPDCNEDIFLTPGLPWLKVIKEYVQKYGWGHVACEEKKKLSK